MSFSLSISRISTFFKDSFNRIRTAFSSALKFLFGSRTTSKKSVQDFYIARQTNGRNLEQARALVHNDISSTATVSETRARNADLIGTAHTLLSQLSQSAYQCAASFFTPKSANTNPTLDSVGEIIIPRQSLR